eukprot:TRINITY_DN44034_c0_g1_i1.p1 TRINITY_DN44034_c0_g1~~TRINITY_DN44034_c0_g1_i1.p1  ORF type:complete len:321 (+),score=65.09 TRINITY_DN44034_c0_g1_i1:112-1074(+)
MKPPHTKSRQLRVKAVRVAVLLAAVYTLWWCLGDSRQNLKRSQLEQLELLRGALADSMNEYVKEGTGATFLPKGSVDRVTEMDGMGFDDYVKSAQPFVLANSRIKCTGEREWSLEMINELAGDDVVGVETSTSNTFYSNEGLKKVRMSVGEFLKEFVKEGRTVDLYLAEENIKEFPKLVKEVVPPEFAEFNNLDKTQLWIGAGGQTSPLHHDQWDNLLCQIRGSRTLTLFDPFQTSYLYPKTGSNRYFSQIDPSKPDLAKFPAYANAKPVTVTLNAGEILFIPAHWWHQVHHGPSVNIAVNFWYIPSLLGELLMATILPE